jgi:probable phosphoglycerate mutase
MTDGLRVVVEADGGSRGNPGPAGYGAVVLDSGADEVLAERSDSIGVDTNNVAEYRGLIAGLEAAAEIGAESVAVRMDSNLVVQQMNGAWRINKPELRALAARANELRRAFAEVTFAWIPRAQNARADALANAAMDAAAGKPPRARATSPKAPLAAGQSWTPPTGPRTRLVLVRHGATVHSADKRFSGHNDLPLNARGRAQAAALAAREFPDVAAVVTSPIRRAHETAERLAGALRVPLSVNDDFAELDFGVFEGLTLAEASERHPEALAAWTASPDTAPPGGESFAELAQRVRRGRDTIVGQFPDATVAVVTHVTPIKMLVRAALDAPLSSIYRMYLDTASVSIVDYLADGAAALRLFNDTSHDTSHVPSS